MALDVHIGQNGTLLRKIEIFIALSYVVKDGVCKVASKAIVYPIFDYDFQFSKLILKNLILQRKLYMQ